MLEIKKFMETDEEFRELARIDNLVNHDSIDHPDDDKKDWELRDKSIIRDRLLLYKNKNRAVTREKMIEQIWGANNFPSNRTVDNYIVKLRKLFDREPEQIAQIISIRGIGYKLSLKQ